MDRITLKARAKINIGLDILGQREDGYHLVNMVMQTISLHDEVTIRKQKENEILIKSNLRYLPSNENNIVYKAAVLIKEEFGIKEGLRFDLKKEIPIAAGMAGGSTDAASTLIRLNRMFDLKLTTDELCIRGSKLGADVPYCIRGGTMLATSIGDVLHPLLPMPECYVVIGKPRMSISTKTVYNKYDDLTKVEHPNMNRLVEEIGRGEIKEIAKHMGNVLELVTIPMVPEITLIKEQMMKEGAMVSMMSGSGPTVFGLFEKQEDAQRAIASLSQHPFMQKCGMTRFWNKK